jgi:hypothetical protein
MSLLQFSTVSDAYYYMQSNPMRRDRVDALVKAVQAVYLHDAPQQTLSPHVDQDGVKFKFNAMWACDVAGGDVEDCEHKLLTACDGHFKEHGNPHFAFAIVGPYWRVFSFKRPTKDGIPTWSSFTGHAMGGPDLEHYADVNEPSEAILVDSLLRDLRQSIG